MATKRYALKGIKIRERFLLIAFGTAAVILLFGLRDGFDTRLLAISSVSVLTVALIAEAIYRLANYVVLHETRMDVGQIGWGRRGSKSKDQVRYDEITNVSVGDDGTMSVHFTSYRRRTLWARMWAWQKAEFSGPAATLSLKPADPRLLSIEIERRIAAAMIGLAFVVIRGPALAGKSTIARSLAERLPGKSALISQDDLSERLIARHDDDFAAETELVYRQMKLLSASYIRAGYHVAVDASFAAFRDGVVATHDADLRDLLGLVSTIPNVRPLLVAVTAPLEALLARARESERWDAQAVEALHRAFESGAFPAAMTIDTSGTSAREAAERILGHLGLRR